MIPIIFTGHKSSFSNSVNKCSAPAITTGHETAEKWYKKSCIGFVLVSKFSHQNNSKSRLGLEILETGGLSEKNFRYFRLQFIAKSFGLKLYVLGKLFETPYMEFSAISLMVEF